jgi:hypothetical protein
MGMQLGPGFLRRPPRGWLPAQASAVRHRVYEWDNSGPDGGQGSLETSCRLDARWRIELPGREPYEFDEERRTAPVWALSGGLIGGGRRWYKVRVAPSYGLMDGVGFPCFVDPDDGRKVWIDWDAAYDAHSEAWGHHARVEREVARRENVWEYAVERVMNPFAGRLKDGELEVAERTHRERKVAAAEQERQVREAAEARMAAQGFSTTKEETDEIKRSAEELKRIHGTGRKTSATVVEQRETGRKLGAIPEIEIVFDVEDAGATRRVRYQHLFGPRAAKRYKPGRTVDVWVDPNDPDAICPGR